MAVKLFDRKPRGVELTADGAAYLPHVRSAFNTIATSTRDLFTSPRERRVTLASPVSINGLWLAPRLAAWGNQHSDVKLSLATIQRPSDYELENAELEIRFGDNVWPGRDHVLLVPEILTAVCAPSLLRNGRDWRELPSLAVAGARAGWTEWCEHAGIPPLPRPKYRFDSLLPAYQAALAGAGLLLASLPLIRDALDAGTLIRVSATELATNRGHWLTRDQRKTMTRDSELMWHWLRQSARA